MTLYVVAVSFNLFPVIVSTELVAFVINEAALKLRGNAVPKAIDIECKL